MIFNAISANGAGKNTDDTRMEEEIMMLDLTGYEQCGSKNTAGSSSNCTLSSSIPANTEIIVLLSLNGSTDATTPPSCTISDISLAGSTAETCVYKLKTTKNVTACNVGAHTAFTVYKRK